MTIRSVSVGMISTRKKTTVSLYVAWLSKSFSCLRMFLSNGSNLMNFLNSFTFVTTIALIASKPVKKSLDLYFERFFNLLFAVYQIAASSQAKTIAEYGINRIVSQVKSRPK